MVRDMHIFLLNPSSDEIDKNTNVIEVYNLVLKGVDDNQRTWYNSGIGTYVRSSFSFAAAQQFVFPKIDQAIAWYADLHFRSRQY